MSIPSKEERLKRAQATRKALEHLKIKRRGAKPRVKTGPGIGGNPELSGDVSSDRHPGAVAEDVNDGPDKGSSC